MQFVKTIMYWKCNLSSLLMTAPENAKWHLDELFVGSNIFSYTTCICKVTFLQGLVQRQLETILSYIGQLNSYIIYIMKYRLSPFSLLESPHVFWTRQFLLKKNFCKECTVEVSNFLVGTGQNVILWCSLNVVNLLSEI
jgi:hypothetical protein